MGGESNRDVGHNIRVVAQIVAITLRVMERGLPASKLICCGERINAHITTERDDYIIRRSLRIGSSAVRQGLCQCVVRLATAQTGSD